MTVKAMKISDLPRELECEILSRVPATFLAQVRFTCKRWYALFKDPSFIKKNLQLGKESATHMVLKKNKEVYSFGIDFNGINQRYDRFILFTRKLRSLKDSQDVKISQIFHCEGLLLCKTKDKRLAVWNPCTGQTRWIIPSSSEGRPSYFLGYKNNNKSCHSYKILSFSCYRNDQNAKIAEFEMYDFNSDSWRVLDVVTHKWAFFGECGVSLKGNTYWLDSEEDTLVNFIRRFDFTTESFGRTPLPFESDDYDLVSVLSVFRDEKLAVSYQTLYHRDQLELKLTIWMTNNTKNGEATDFSWSQFLVVEFLGGMTRVRSFSVDEENKRVMCCDADRDTERTRVYIVGEDILKQLYRDGANGTKFGSQLLLSYVPSLVQIPASRSNPRGGKRKRHGQEAIALTKSK